MSRSHYLQSVRFRENYLVEYRPVFWSWHMKRGVSTTSFIPRSWQNTRLERFPAYPQATEGGGNLIPYQNSKRSGRDQSLHPLFYQYPPPLSVGLLPSLCSVHSIWGKYTRVLFLDIFSVCRSNQSQNYFSLHQPPARQETASFSFILAIQNSSCEFFLPLTRYVGGWGTITRGSHNEQKSKQFSTGSGHVIAARWPDGA